MHSTSIFCFFPHITLLYVFICYPWFSMMSILPLQCIVELDYNSNWTKLQYPSRVYFAVISHKLNNTHSSISHTSLITHKAPYPCLSSYSYLIKCLWQWLSFFLELCHLLLCLFRPCILGQYVLHISNRAVAVLGRVNLVTALEFLKKFHRRPSINLQPLYPKK